MESVQLKNICPQNEQELQTYYEYLRRHALQLEAELSRVRQAMAQVSFYLRDFRQLGEDKSRSGFSNVSTVTGESLENTCLSRNTSFSSFGSSTARSDTMQQQRVGDKRRRVNKGSSGRYWSSEEHERFLEALEKYGQQNLKAVASYVGTRTAVQCRTHLQKYLLRLERESQRGLLKQKDSKAEKQVVEADFESRRPWEDRKPSTLENEVPFRCNSERSKMDSERNVSLVGGVHLLCVAAQEVSAR
ncbi:Myb-like protein I [Galdieria sulphuraria]|uniref:Myb domain-containing protein n=1 Tax=Galdieria sulphuraria TaxID=130081 RepID=M2XPW4_GALSU|nr:myb domain-containing protein [Galdieria sulphuraria]EME32257.1 myb domain-containing protein [Galdieria sulphuraria]GJD09685.1 Myb-like protein I [Galdieria sulphuraria]|eukprot:XP_005708777.1 myb domain-containing protein [Galdieria sulphuraria]